MKLKKLFAALLTVFIAAGCSGQAENSGTNAVKDLNPSIESNSIVQTESAPAAQPAAKLTPTLNGKAPDEVQHTYTEDQYGANFGTYITTGNLLFGVAAVIPNSVCANGYTLNYKDVSDSKTLVLVIYDLRGSQPIAGMFNATQNKDVITDGSVTVTSFNLQKSIDFNISMKFTYDGVNYEYSGSGSADYIAFDAQQSSQQQSDSTCFYCSGSGRCHVCGGMGYTNWGGTRNDCSACYGLGSCYYCNGTGIQYYETRGFARQY